MSSFGPSILIEREVGVWQPAVTCWLAAWLWPFVWGCRVGVAVSGESAATVWRFICRLAAWLWRPCVGGCDMGFTSYRLMNDDDVASYTLTIISVLMRMRI
jgi:hypothetical protein